MPYKNKEDRIANSKNYYQSNKDKIKSYIKTWCLKNKDKVHKYARKSRKKRSESGAWASYYEENQEKIKARSRDHGKHWRQMYPDRAKNQTLKKKYGITLEQYEEKLKSQGMLCACCGLELDEKSIIRKPQVDHCHSTGLFRGILCRTCNIVEGFLEKKGDVLALVIEYKEKFL